MPAKTDNLDLNEIGVLLRGDVDSIATRVEQWTVRRSLLYVVVIVFGAGCYGAAMGCWRSPQQALFVAIKFPVIMILTTLGNALINAMLAPLLGLNMTFRHSFSAVLMSLTITAAILGAFSPLLVFAVWNAPAMVAGSAHNPAYNIIMLANVLVIALAGTAGNLRLFQLLMQVGRRRDVALRVLFAWQVANLFLGSQLSWILRPFIGSPTLPVEFLRTDAFHGNFYEAVAHALKQIINN
jgi:hypothetical protein